MAVLFLQKTLQKRHGIQHLAPTGPLVCWCHLNHLKSFDSRQFCQLLLRLGISNANMSHRCTEGHLKKEPHTIGQSSDGGHVRWWHYVSLQETSITHNPGKSSVNTTVLLPTERNQALRVQNMLRCCKWTVKKLTWYYEYLIRTRWASSSASVCWLRFSGGK